MRKETMDEELLKVMQNGTSGPRTGSVKFFDGDKGFGFIIPDEGGPDVFMNRRDIDGQTLGVGERVTYELTINPRNGKTKAMGVRVLEQVG
jgi:CspA family cold shock protein